MSVQSNNISVADEAAERRIANSACRAWRWTKAAAPAIAMPASTRRRLRLDRCVDALGPRRMEGNSRDRAPGAELAPKYGRGEGQFPPPPARTPVKAGEPGTAGWATADRQTPRSINRHAGERTVTPDNCRWWRPLNIIVLTWPAASLTT